jgi:hypothetical protein
MADIDVVKKGSGSRAWLWVLMLVVLAIVLWMVLAGGGPDATSSGGNRMFAPAGPPLHAAAFAVTLPQA